MDARQTECGAARFLAELPLTLQDDDRLYVHAEASDPLSWRYVQSAADAARSIQATSAHATFCGHIHQPALYSMSAAAKMTSFVPIVRRLSAVAWRPAMARRSRFGGAAPRRQSGGVVCDARYHDQGNHLLPCALRCRGRGEPDPCRRPAALARRSPVGREVKAGNVTVQDGPRCSLTASHRYDMIVPGENGFHGMPPKRGGMR